MATTPDGDTEYYLEVTYKPNTTSTDDSKKNTTTSDGMQHFVALIKFMLLRASFRS